MANELNSPPCPTCGAEMYLTGYVGVADYVTETYACPVCDAEPANPEASHD